MPWPFLTDLLKREILSHTATMISLEDVLTDKQVVKRQMCDPTDMTQAYQRMGRGAWVCGVRWLEVVTQHGSDSSTCWKKKPWELLQTSLKTFNTKNWMVRRRDIGRILCYCFLSHLGRKRIKTITSALEKSTAYLLEFSWHQHYKFWTVSVYFFMFNWKIKLSFLPIWVLAEGFLSMFLSYHEWKWTTVHFF